jgi:hypothetical protein
MRLSASLLAVLIPAFTIILFAKNRDSLPDHSGLGFAHNTIRNYPKTVFLLILLQHIPAATDLRRRFQT